MTRKRFKKLLMGRYGYSRTQAADTAALVAFRGRATDGGYIFLHDPNKCYADVFIQCKIAEVFARYATWQR